MTDSTNNQPASSKTPSHNHYSHAPVVWLVQGNVTINGIVSLSGNNGTSSAPGEYTPTEPGPGGFRGGALDLSIGYGDGFGPGGGTTSGNTGGTYQTSYVRKRDCAYAGSRRLPPPFSDA
jgi:hypothetical protein